MPGKYAHDVPKELADKFDEVVAEGPASPLSPFGSAAPADASSPRSQPPSGAAISAAMQEALEALREDVRQGLAAAAQIQFDALVPLRAEMERLTAEVAALKKRSEAGPAMIALRDEVRHLSATMKSAPAGAASREALAELWPQLDELRQELRRDGDALRATVLDAARSSRAGDGGDTAAGLAALRDAVADVRAVVERERSAVGGLSLEMTRAIESLRRDFGARIGSGDAGAVEAVAAGFDAGLKDLAAKVEGLRTADEKARQAASAAREDLMHTLEAFHDELVEQWRERKVFEASVPPQLEGLRKSLADAVARLTAGLGLLPAAVEAQRQTADEGGGAEGTGASAVAGSHATPDGAAQGVNGELLKEVAALRGELADRAGDLDEFLRTAVSGANRWFVKMRDDLFQRIDEFGVAATAQANGGQDGEAPLNRSLAVTLDALRVEVDDLHTYLSRVDADLRRFHDTVSNGPARDAAGD